MLPPRLLFLCFAVFLLASCQPVTLPAATSTVPATQADPTATAGNSVSDLPAALTATTLPEPPTPTPLPSPTPASVPINSGAPSAGDPYAPELGNTGYDVERYDLALSLDPSTPEISGTAILYAVATLDQLSRLSLDFVGFDLDDLAVDGAPAGFTREGGKVWVDLPTPLARGTPFSLALSYSGSPAREPSRFVPFVPYLGLITEAGNLFVLAEPDGARYWFPCNDHPTDKAAFSFHLTVPDGLVGVANGELTGEVDLPDPTTTYSWELDAPMATYLATIAVGEYVLAEEPYQGSVTIRSYVFPDHLSEFQQWTGLTAEFLDWMEELFMPYPYSEVGFVTMRNMNASLETQTMIILSDQMISDYVMIHELAHQWFGDWVSMASWADMWHNEGLATYITMLWMYRSDPTGLQTAMDAEVAKYSSQTPGYPMGNLPPGQLFSSTSYNKGAAFIHAIREQVGDDAFFAALRLYLQRYGGGTASRSDFQAIFEETSGQDLSPLFKQWLE